MTAATEAKTVFVERHGALFSSKLEAKRVIEALLFASNIPLAFGKIRQIVEGVHPFTPRELLALIHELKLEYEHQLRAFELVEIAEGYVLRTRGDYGVFIDQLMGHKRPERLSQAATEVLAIIAYRQPITRPQIEALRGVDCSGVLTSLIERQLVEAVGKLESPGRPTLYGVTKQFLHHFGLRHLDDLKATPEQKDPSK